ncbi:MAG TPA: diguanylate cyclase [Candidatus Baltobacteraceae bacterium]|nr:diguanylate cyclase [Candidatus Baltobacteraceae bacterium]
MNRSERNLEIVRQTAEILSSGSGLSETFERFCLMLAKFIEASVVFIAIKRHDGVHIDFAYDHGTSMHNPMSGRRVGLDSQTQHVIETGQPVFVRTLREIRGPVIPLKEVKDDDSQSAIFVPLRFGSETIGVLSVQTTERCAYSPDDLHLLETCALYVAVTVQAEKMRGEKEALQSVASRDALTGVASRRAFDQRLHEDWTRAQREDGVLSVLVMDVDWFKRFNDTYGHVAGDACLNQVAQAAQSCIVRDADMLARYGGEEFTAILWQTDAAGAAVVAERVLNAVRALDAPHAESPLGRVTASIGVAGCKALAIADPQTLLKAADRALYAAKTAGRDRIHVDPLGGAAATLQQPAARTNIRSQATALMGRAPEIAALNEAIKRSRIVTLAGKKGIGKTRIAVAAAQRRLYAYPDGTWLIDCSVVAGAALEEAVLGAMRVPQSAGLPARETLIDALKDRNTLLIFDDCGEIGSQVAALCECIARSAPDVAMLATSRAPLGGTGEEIFELQSPILEDAAALFIDRAQIADKSFEASEQNRQTIERICTILEKVPLAIELTAPRVRAMPLEHVLGLLERENADASIDGLVRSSYEQLGTNARRLFERLSVFPSLFTSAAARDVCSGGDLEPWDVTDALDDLVVANLVKRFDSGETARYLVVDSARNYGREVLRERLERAAIQWRFIRYFRAVARRASVRIEGGNIEGGIDEARAEIENLDGALEYALNRRVDVSAGADIVVGLHRFWVETGRLAEGRHWTDIALAAGLPMGPQSAELLAAAAAIAHFRGDMVRLADLSERLVAHHERGHDAAAMARALNGLATARFHLGEAAGAKDLFQRALKEYRKAGDRRGVAVVLSNLGALATETLSDVAGARALFSESLTLFRELGVSSQTGISLSNLAAIAIIDGDYEQALVYANESLIIFERLENVAQATVQLIHIAHARLERGEIELSRATLMAARERLRREPTIRNTIDLYETAFLFACDCGEFEGAAQLFGIADAVRQKHHLPRTALSSAESSNRERAVRANLGNLSDSYFEKGRAASTAEMERMLDRVLSGSSGAVAARRAAR